MKYDLVVTSLHLKNAPTVVARHLAQTSGITLQQARVLVDSLPVTLFRNVEEVDVPERVRQFAKLGIELQSIPANPEAPLIPESHTTGGLPPVSQRRIYSVSPQKKSNSVIAAPHPDEELPVKSNVSPSETVRRNRKAMLWLGGALLLVVLLIFGAQNLSVHKKNIQPFQAKNSLSKKHASSAGNGPRTISDAQGKSKNNTMPFIDRQKSQTLVDSAEAAKNDIEGAIRFYQMAISFNKHNIHAWYGLLEAYRSLDRKKEMQETIESMQQIFGESGFSAERIIRSFGVLLEYEMSADGTLSVEYRAKKSDEAALLHQSFLIVRELRNICNCKNISLFASISAGSGMVVHIPADAVFSTPQSFQAAATVQYFQPKSPLFP